MMAIGPKPPPYLKGDMYHPDIQGRSLGVQASTRVRMNRRSPIDSRLASGSAKKDTITLESSQEEKSLVQAYFPVDIIILTLCVISTAWAIARVCWMVAYKRYTGRNTSLAVTIGQVIIESFRLFRTFRRGTNSKVMEQYLSVESRQAGSVRVLKKVRRRLHYHRCSDAVHELLRSNRVFLGRKLNQSIDTPIRSTAMTSGVSN